MRTEHTTSLVEEQSRRLRPTLRRFDILFLLVAAVVSIEILGQISSFGGETFTWTLIVAATFLVPYALVFAEVGSTFTDEGGPYVWVKLAFGRLVAAVATLFYWVTTPVWIGGSMAFLAAATWGGYLSPVPAGSATDYVFKLVFIWATVLAAVVSLRVGKWLPTAGAIAKVALLAFFLVTTVAYASVHGAQGIGFGDLAPTLSGSLGVLPLLVFAYLGFEVSNGAAGEMRNPQRDVPISLTRSAAVAALCYLAPVLAILVVLPMDQITGIGGLMEAIATVFGVYGAAAPFLLDVAAAVFVFVLVAQGAAWMIASDRVQAIAGADGAFFGGVFGVFHPRLGTPIRVNLLSGCVASVFMLAATNLVEGTSAALFGVVLTICVSTYLLSYLVVIPAAGRLRTTHPDLVRSFRVPGPRWVYRALVALCFCWVALGSWMTVFPGSLERLMGVPYPFEEHWGVSFVTFTGFTLGTLGLLAVLALVGYAGGRTLRRSAAAHPTARTGVRAS